MLRKSKLPPFRVVQAYFDEDFGARSEVFRIGGRGLEGELLGDDAPSARVSVAELAERCSLVIALHPDEATEAAVRFAVNRRKPFAVVPCCVYSRIFPERRLRVDAPSADTHRSAGGDEPPAARYQPVTTYEDLLAYLQQMHPAIKRAVLPGCGGKSTVLYVASLEEYAAYEFN